MIIEKYDSLDILVRIEFEDGYFHQVHDVCYDYENDFYSLIVEHGNITDILVSAVLVNAQNNE